MKKILIVEDDRILSYLLEKQVKRLGYNVVGRVETGFEAIDAVSELKPDVIMMDINLEGEVDGIEAMKAIRISCDTPFLYITGNSDPMTRKRAMETKPDGYLVKPIDLNTLGEALSAVLS